jgi:hypothetical protein
MAVMAGAAVVDLALRHLVHADASALRGSCS